MKLRAETSAAFLFTYRKQHMTEKSTAKSTPMVKLYDVKVALSSLALKGQSFHEVVRKDVTPFEIEVLRALHGVEFVKNIAENGRYERRTPKDVISALSARYTSASPDPRMNGQNVVKAVWTDLKEFPHEVVALPEAMFDEV
jgi:hypothetical protein